MPAPSWFWKRWYLKQTYFGRRRDSANSCRYKIQKAGKIYYFDPALSSVTQGDHAIVETARGVEYGEVVVGPREVSDSEVVSPLKPVLRKATDEDAQKVEENIVREKEAFNICLRKITNHDLPMRLIDVEFTFDVNKSYFISQPKGV